MISLDLSADSFPDYCEIDQNGSFLHTDFEPD